MDMFANSDSGGDEVPDCVNDEAEDPHGHVSGAVLSKRCCLAGPGEILLIILYTFVLDPDPH